MCNDHDHAGVTIHPTAIVDHHAELGVDVTVGPYAIIERHTKIGDRCVIDAQALVRSHVTMGPECRVHPHAVIGDLPQDLTFKGGTTAVVIGRGCTFREGATVHQSTKEGGATRLGDYVYLMVQAHVAHDCVVHDKVIMVNGSALAGHVTVETGAFLSAFVGIHQFCRVGRNCLVAANIKIDHDAPPYVIIDGSPKEIRRVNAVGLQRAGFAADEVQALDQSYRNLAAAADPMEAAKALAASPFPHVRHIAEFYAASKRGVLRRFQKHD